MERPSADSQVLTRSEVLAAISYLLHLANAEPGYRLDDRPFRQPTHPIL